MVYLDSIGWYPGIGDPTLLGWFTVVAYGLAAALCFRVAYGGAALFGLPAGRQIKLWLGIGVLLVLLAINKQLDLQSFFTASAKFLAKRQGWYDDRRQYQLLFICAVFTLGTIVCVWFLYLYRHCLKTHGLALMGLCCLLCFVVVRAASFHHVDRLIGVGLGAFRVNHLLELGAIALIGANAVILWRRQ